MSPGLRVLARATRLKTVPLILAPVGVGTALAVDGGAPFSPDAFALAATGAAALYLGGVVLNDYFDERSGADGIARMDRTAIVTGAGLIASRTMTPRGMLGLAGALWAAALAAGVVLAAAREPWVLALGAAGALLAHQYSAPPLRYGYRGIGAAGVALAFGFLPVAGAAAVQSRAVTAASLWVGVAPALLAAAVFLHADLLHWRADRTARKRTPAARFGPEGALAITGALLVAAYVVVTVQVALGTLPAWALLALLTAPSTAMAWARAARDPIAQHALGLLGASLGAAVLVQAALALALAYG